MAINYESIAIVAEQQVSGTEGGSASATTTATRTLNTEVYDPNAIVTLSANQFTLGAGTYEIEAWVPSFDTGLNKAWIYNATDTANAIIGLSAVAEDTNSAFSYCHVVGVVTILSPKAFEVRHYTEVAQATNGLGAATSWGTEQYTTVVIRKITSTTQNDSIAYCVDEKTLGTDGGNATSGSWATRDLNTEDFDPDAIVSISANQFTLGKGTYEVVAYAALYDCGIVQARLYNATDTSEIAVGANALASATNDNFATPVVVAGFTLADTKAIELQARCSTNETNGFGEGVGCDFDAERYATVYIRKTA